MGALDETLNLAVRVSQRALVGLAVLIVAPPCPSPELADCLVFAQDELFTITLGSLSLEPSERVNEHAGSL